MSWLELAQISAVAGLSVCSATCFLPRLETPRIHADFFFFWLGSLALRKRASAPTPLLPTPLQALSLFLPPSVSGEALPFESVRVCHTYLDTHHISLFSTASVCIMIFDHQVTSAAHTSCTLNLHTCTCPSRDTLQESPGITTLTAVAVETMKCTLQS